MPLKKINCFCGRDDEGFMIQCDNCTRWFHGVCVSVSSKKSKAFGEWYCLWCKSYKQAEERLAGQFNIFKAEAKSKIKAEVLKELKALQGIETHEHVKADNKQVIVDNEVANLKQHLLLKEKNIESLQAEIKVYQDKAEEDQVLINDLNNKLVIQTSHENQVPSELLSKKIEQLEQEKCALEQELLKVKEELQISRKRGRLSISHSQKTKKLCDN